MTRAEVVFLVLVSALAVWQEVQWHLARRRSERLRARIGAWTR